MPQSRDNGAGLGTTVLSIFIHWLLKENFFDARNNLHNVSYFISQKPQKSKCN